MTIQALLYNELDQKCKERGVVFRLKRVRPRARTNMCAHAHTALTLLACRNARSKQHGTERPKTLG